MAAYEGSSITRGAVSGLVGGIVYFVFAIAITIYLGGFAAVETPLRQIAAVALGPQALSAEYDLTTAVVVANVVHFALSAIYGVIFAVIIRNAAVVSGRSLTVAGAVYGLAIYAINRLVIFPKLFPWFLVNDPVLQSALHALAFGAVIGAWLARSRSS
jgi:uncharacterized membrane protein YagU involved in acid resistance